MTGEKDLVLIHFEDQPLSYARIESIDADHKPGWYHVKLLMLQIPLQVVTWILRDAYLDGDEFTMGGKRMRLTRVECPPEPKVVKLEGESDSDAGSAPEKDDTNGSQTAGQGKVISFPPKK